MLQLFINLKILLFKISIKCKSIIKFITINRIKLFLFFFILIYTIALIIFIFFLFKHYKETVLIQNTEEIEMLNKSIFKLINHSNVLMDYNSESTRQLYANIRANYQPNLLNIDSNHMNTLDRGFHAMKMAEDSRKQQMIENMIGSHVEVITDITREFLKITFKFSTPLIAACIAMAGIQAYEWLSETSDIILA